MAGSISPSTGVLPPSCWSTTPIRRPLSSRPRCFSGPGSNRRSIRRIIPKRADQFNSIHERLIEAWTEARARRRHLHLAGDDRERRGSPARWPISRTSRSQAGLHDHADRHRGHRTARRRPLRRSRRPRRSNSPSSSIPGNGCFATRSARSSLSAPTRWIEPPWKAILSNKGILPLLWEMFPNHPNLLPAYFEDDPKAATLGASFVRKPLLFARGRQRRAGQRRRDAGRTGRAPTAPKASSGRRSAPLPNFSGQYPGARKLAGRRIRPAGCRSARTRTRSPATRRVSCRTPFCSARKAQRADATARSRGCGAITGTNGGRTRRTAPTFGR